MQTNEKIQITPEEIVPTAEKMRAENRLLIMIHGHMENDGTPVVSYDYDDGANVLSFEVRGHATVPTISHIYDAAAQGDAAAGRIIDEYIDYLACGVASLVNIFQPEVLCVGGGPSAQGETLLAPVRYILDREDYARNNVRRTRLMGAALGNDAGIIGAALLPLFR